MWWNVVLKSKIESDVYFAFRKSQVEALFKGDRTPGIHVSDLIKDCMRYTIYGKVLPPINKSTEDMKSMYFGQAVHSNSNMASKPEYHEMELIYNWVKDTMATAVDPKNPWDYITGTIDDLLEVEGELIISDKKTTGSLDYFKRYGKASDSHKAQTNMYRVLLNKCKNLDSKWGCNVYISNCIEKDKRDQPVILSYKLEKPEETLEIMLKGSKLIKDSMLKGTLPGRTKCFLCDGMCPHASLCFVDERKKWNTEQ